MRKKVTIGQSDLIIESKSINERYFVRKIFLNENLFSDEDGFEFYQLLNSLLEKCDSNILNGKLSRLTTIFIAKLFIVDQFNISQISEYLSLKSSEVAWHLLIFLSEIYTDRFLLNNFFQVDDLSNKYFDRNIFGLKEIFNDDRDNLNIFNCGKKMEMRSLLEAPGWDSILANSKNEKNKNLISFKMPELISVKFILSYLGLILLMGSLLFFGLKINEMNELKLFSKINLPSRFFTWLDINDFIQLNIFEKKEKLPSENQLSYSDVVVERSIEEDRFEVESDVILTSLDKIGKEEASSLEEIKKGQFRDNRFGNKKVYRLMITTPDVFDVSEKLTNIIEKHNAVKGGNVQPGSELPGGLYYNLLVPTKNLKQFFSEIDKTESLNIYLSQSKMFAPIGQSNVFIWVKKI